MRVLPVEVCPACGGSQSSGLDVGDQPLRRCDACGLVHVAEMADPDEVYVEGYLTGGSEFGPPDTTAPVIYRYVVFAGHRRLAAMRRLTRSSELGPLLDVGCGTGELLVAAKEEGVEALGVEPVPESVRIACERGVDARAVMLEESGLPEGGFATVTAFHVLEHMADGPSFLRLLARWARPGGHVVVEVPNWRSMNRRRMGDSWPLLRPLEHVAHYAPATLAATMRRAGLVDVQVRTLTYLFSEQTVPQAFADVGWSGLERRVPGVLRRGDRPGRVLSAALHATAAVYDRAKVGQVVMAVGRKMG
jgi:SAM-dependent methyltransferase